MSLTKARDMLRDAVGVIENPTVLELESGPRKAGGQGEFTFISSAA